MIEERLTAALLPYLEETSEGQQFDIDPASALASFLEIYFSHRIKDHYPEWTGSLDGLQIFSAKKLDSYSVEMYGIAFLLGNQSKEPFYVCLSVDISESRLDRAYIRMGDRRWNGKKAHVIETLNAPIDEIEWQYIVDIDGPEQ